MNPIQVEYFVRVQEEAADQREEGEKRGKEMEGQITALQQMVREKQE